MTIIPADKKLKYVLNWKSSPEGPAPNEWRNVVFAEPRETFTLPTGGADGTKQQEYVRVLNPDINQGRIRYPFESEFKEGNV